jgi:Na+/H+ antiporter NhaA
VLSHVLTFTFFVLIGLEIREGLNRPKEIILPGLCALSGMIFPAIIFIALHTGANAWAVAMPTDVALAIGALSFLGKRVNPSVRLFLLTLAVADDFLSLVVIGIFFRSKLDLASSIYTLGAAAIGFLLPFRRKLIKYLSPVATFVVIPIYIWINLLSHLNFSLAIAEITLATTPELDQVRIGLFFAAIISGVFGTLWLGFNSKSNKIPKKIKSSGGSNPYKQLNQILQISIRQRANQRDFLNPLPMKQLRQFQPVVRHMYMRFRHL